MLVVNRRTILILIAVSAALTLTACGGAKQPAASSDGYSTPTPAAPATPAATVPTTPAPAAPATPVATVPTTPAPAALAPLEVTLNLKDYSFDPKQITAVKGQKVIVTLKNMGDRTHDMVFSGAYNGVKSSQIEVGKEGKFEFVADAAGNFEFICSLRGHKDRGMVGKLIVE